jgi:hypothetical protein
VISYSLRVSGEEAAVMPERKSFPGRIGETTARIGSVGFGAFEEQNDDEEQARVIRLRVSRSSGCFSELI